MFPPFIIRRPFAFIMIFLPTKDPLTSACLTLDADGVSLTGFMAYIFF